jgi:hypothetical protein
MALEEPVSGPDDLDALLRRELRVAPSAAFLPGVRARVAADRIARRDWLWRLLVPAGACVVTCAAALSLLSMGTVAPPAPAAPGLPVPAAVPSITAEVALESGASRPAPVADRVASLVRAEVLPPVIVDEAQRAAIRSVLFMVEQGTLTAEAFMRTNPSSFQPVEDGVRPIALPAVEVSPIPVGGVLQAGTNK